MVATNSDGTFSHFDWKKQYDFLISEENFDGDLEGIVQAKLEVMKREEPEEFKTYEELSELLSAQIATASEEEGFGYESADAIVLKFVREHDLHDLFENFPLLFNTETPVDEFITDDWLAGITKDVE